MVNTVKHGKRYYKQMALEVAVRNPERYEGILQTFAKYEGITLNDDGILNVYALLYLDGALTASSLKGSVITEEYVKEWIQRETTHNNEWGFPTGYQAAFTRYLKTLSEFGFIYAQYNQPLLLSPVAKALVSKKITLSDAFALQCMRYWRKSPYRRVLNDFNFFEFVMDALLVLKENGHRLSYYQFMVALFSDNGDVQAFLDLLESNKIGDSADKAYELVKKQYDSIDSEHAKVVQQNSAFRDYGNTVFRVLQLTGFVSVDYTGVLMLSPNVNRMDFYHALKDCHFSITEAAKEDEYQYFQEIGSYDATTEQIIQSFCKKEDASTQGYKQKIEHIVEAYNLTKEQVEQDLLRLSDNEKKGKDTFWFIQDPVKLEFLLTLYLYLHLGEDYEYKPNYICDEMGIPFSHAPGNIGDIEIYNDKLYWLLEATLIRSKTQQINNETVNLFRHIDDNYKGRKYLTLVAPYIHNDTKLIFKVASIITMVEKNMISLNSEAQTVADFIADMNTQRYFNVINAKTRQFLESFKIQLNSISTYETL
ncbi:MAG: AlwI family type II restriction endonuclease [Alloprevotella sp.]